MQQFSLAFYIWTETAVTSTSKWAKGLSVNGSVRLVTCGDRSLTRCVDRAVTDAQLSAWLNLNVQKEPCASVCVLHNVRESMRWAPALQRERGHASCFSPQRRSPEAGQRGRGVKGGSTGTWHSHNTSGICDVTLHLSNEISFSNYNKPPYPPTKTYIQIRHNNKIKKFHKHVPKMSSKWETLS